MNMETQDDKYELGKHRAMRTSPSSVLCQVNTARRKDTEYLLHEKVQIVKWFYQGHSIPSIVGLFRNNFKDRPVPCFDTIRRFTRNFDKFGCVSPSKHKKPKSNTNEERDIMICASIENNFAQTTTQISQQVGVSRATVARVLRKNKYRCYRLPKKLEIFPRDNHERIQFCLDIIEKCAQNEDFIANILFTEETTFFLQGAHDSLQVRHGMYGNNHNLYTAQKLNVWVGILGDNIIGPFFIDSPLNTQKYIDLLQINVLPCLFRIPNLDLGNVWYQQNGCPSYNSASAQQYLRTFFGDRIISKQGTISWPAKSPDLSPNDFFLWAYIKSKIYSTEEEQANNLNELRLKITNCLKSITPDVFANVRRNFYDRVALCLEIEGGRFEHLSIN